MENNYLNDVFIGLQIENLDKSFSNSLYFIINIEQKEKVLNLVDNNPFNITFTEVAQMYNPNSLVYRSSISKLYSSSDVLNYYISEFKKEGINYCIK